jgi:hypothetical protein
MSEWQPIATAPKDGTPVLIAKLNKHGWWIDVAENWSDNGPDHGPHPEDAWTARESIQISCRDPSHWRPLPSPPPPIPQDQTQEG